MIAHALNAIRSTVDHLRVMRLFKGGKYAPATLLAERVLLLREKAFGLSHPLTATALNTLARLYSAQGAYAKAEPLLVRALAIDEKALGPEHPDTASLINNLAGLYQVQCAYEKAEPLVMRTIIIREKALGSEHPEVANALNNLALLYEEQGMYAKAELLWRRALVIREKLLGQEHPDVAQSLHNLAMLYKEQGAYEKAEPLSRRALAIDEKVFGPEHLNTALSLNALALLYKEQGAYEKAESLYQRGLAIMEKVLGAEHLDTALLLENLAGLYRAQGACEKAESLYQRALAINEKALGPDHPHNARALNNLAVLYLAQGAYAKAKPFLVRALAIYENALGPEHPGVATVFNNLALLYKEQGAYEKAGALYRRALSLREQALGPEHPLTATSLHSLAILYWGVGDVDRTLCNLERAMALDEHHLARTFATLSELRKRLFLQTLAIQAQLPIAFHARDASRDGSALALALTTTLRRKGRVLDEVARAHAALRSNLSPALRNELDALYLRRAELAARRSVPFDPRHADALRVLREEVERREAELSHKSAAFRAQIEPVTLEAVQSAMPRDATLVEFVYYRHFDPNDRARWQEARYLAYVLQYGVAPRWVALGEAAPIEAAVALALAALARSGSDAHKTLRALDELIFAPLRRLLGPVERWLLSPDGALHVVPFAALVDEKGCYLAERTRITYLTSGRDLLRPAARHAPSTRPLIMAAPDYRGRQTPLPGTAAEADALRAHFPEAEVFVGAVATKAVLARARAPLFVHIATHGFVRALRSPELPRAARSWCEAWREGRPLVAFDPVRPPPDGGADPEDALDAAGLVLAGATDAEAMLTAREVAALDLGGTQLAVLSACETGVGDIRAGEGVYGLRRALAIAGVEAQVVSLWKVHDAATAELMDDYYGRLRRGEGRSEALRQAQLAMLHKPTRAHPYYWAAFVPIGDERPLRFGLEGGEAKGKPWG